MSKVINQDIPLIDGAIKPGVKLKVEWIMAKLIEQHLLKTNLILSCA